MIGTLVATLAWSTLGGRPAAATLQGGAGQPLATVHFAPRLLVGGPALQALLLPDGRVFVHRGDGPWSPRQLPDIDLVAAALLPEGDLVLLGQTSDGPRLQRLAAEGVVWSVPADGTALHLAGARLTVQQRDALVRIDPATGDETSRAPLDGYRGPVWTSPGAWFGVEQRGGRRHWVQHPDDGAAVVRPVSAELSGLITRACGPLPDGGAVLPAGQALVWMSATGTEQARHELPEGADLEHAVVDDHGATWVVVSDESRVELWRIPVP
jgi:hypothetical protein